MSCSQGDGPAGEPADDVNRCSYVHDVSNFEDVDGPEWRCPRDAEPGHGRCGFHLDPADTPDGWDGGTALLDALTDGQADRDARRENRRFFGAKLEALVLDHVSLGGPDNYPIDLRDVHVTGDVDLTKAVVDLPLWLEAATVAGDVSLHRTRFAEHVSLDGLTCNGDVVADRATFDRNLDAEELTVDGDVDFRGAVFDHYVGFIGSRIRGDFSLHNATVGDHAHLHHLQVGGEADFSNGDFTRRFWCFHSTFEGPVEMEKATVAGPAFFDHTSFEGAVNYWNTTFEGRVRWKEAVFHADLVADHLTTESTARFPRAEFHAAVDLSHLQADAGLWVSEPTAVPNEGDEVRVDLQHATLPDGRLDVAAGGTVSYDLTCATLGDVDISLSRPDDLIFYRFDRTNFDGFDFAGYHDALDRNRWRLDSPSPDETLDSTRGEETYLKAKNGAKLVGDATAAAEFYRLELTHRRRNHAARARADDSWSDRLTAAGRWTASALLDLTTGYGERPWRVIGSSVLVIGLFVVIYAAAFESAPYGSAFGYLVFSVESFVALVLGGAPPIEQPLIRFVAQVEGFMGAFFIALFVFTLTRSVQR